MHILQLRGILQELEIFPISTVHLLKDTAVLMILGNYYQKTLFQIN